MTKLLLAPFAALLVAGAANAGPLQTLTLQEHAQAQSQQGGQLNDIFEVHSRRSAGNIIVTDALYGGLCGLAIGGGVALITQDGNWGRDLGVGAGIGLLVGAVFGIVDANSYGDRAPPPGFGSAYHLVGGRF